MLRWLSEVSMIVHVRHVFGMENLVRCHALGHMVKNRDVSNLSRVRETALCCVDVCPLPTNSENKRTCPLTTLMITTPTWSIAQRFASDGHAYRTMRGIPMNNQRVSREPGERTSDLPRFILTHA